MKEDHDTYLIYWLPLNSWYENIYNNATEIEVSVFVL
jgi:hypothetical protein